MNKKYKLNKGFTLMELLIVIGILAILATSATLVLNPAELLRQSRDSTRINDLSTLNTALSLYVTNVSSPDMDGGTSSCSTLCYLSVGSETAPANCASRHGSKTTTNDATREVDGTGWIPVAFTDIPGGAPLSVLPIDPLEATSTPYHFYSYACNNSAKTYELNATFESTKYIINDNYDGRDGGNKDGIYEVGSEPGLDI